MWQAVVARAQRFVGSIRPVGPASVASTTLQLAPLNRVVLTDGVGRTLFDGFADHLRGERWDEETGWLLLGHRQAQQAVVLAALPAGQKRDAGRAHVRFNTTAQLLGSHILRQRDRRLTILGVAHTHPGRLRRPSKGDLRGDRDWVRRLRGGEGVFAIGTADARASGNGHEAPRPHVECQRELRFSWYSLRQGERRYRPLPVEWTLGPDLARQLHDVWATVEEHAEGLERLLRQPARFAIDVIAEGLLLTLPLAEEGSRLRVALHGPNARYFSERRGGVAECHPGPGGVDRAVCQLLAALSGGAGGSSC